MCQDILTFDEICRNFVATGMELRAVEDAIHHGGPLIDAILQLQGNFENGQAADLDGEIDGSYS